MTVQGTRQTAGGETVAFIGQTESTSAGNSGSRLRPFDSQNNGRGTTDVTRNRSRFAVRDRAKQPLASLFVVVPALREPELGVHRV